MDTHRFSIQPYTGILLTRVSQKLRGDDSTLHVTDCASSV